MFRSDDWIDRREAELVSVEREISQLRARQAVLVNELDRARVDRRHGARSMVDWVAGRVDVSTETARRLLYAAWALPKCRAAGFRLAAKEITFDRAVAVARYAETGASREQIDSSFAVDLVRLGRQAASRRRLTRSDEQQAFQDRYLAIQPTLDESSSRFWGQLPGVDARVFEKAIDGRADEIRDLPGGDLCSRSQRRADALVAMAHDSLDRGADPETTSGPVVSVFVDATATDTRDGISATVEYGPRVGPNSLEEFLCTGSVQIIGLQAGRPVVASDATRAVPPAIRRFVAWRDGGCTAEGCQSRYRLQPHHIVERSRGGSHDPANLTTLCWYHHHIVIHGSGFRIDPDSPPQRRRFLPPSRAGRGPP